MPRKRLLAPTMCLEEAPTRKSIRLGGRFISVTRLCEYGMDHGYLSYILSGERTPSVTYGKKVARCLGIYDEFGQPDFAGLLTLIEERRQELAAERQRRAG